MFSGMPRIRLGKRKDKSKEHIFRGIETFMLAADFGWAIVGVCRRMVKE